MTDRPIIFSAPMVRALLDGRKSQTRRVLKPQPEHLQVYDWKGSRIHDSEHRHWCWRGHVGADNWDDITTQIGPALPYAPGDRLWCKEVWGLGISDHGDCPRYKATLDYMCGDKIVSPHEGPFAWKSPRFMPKRFSRLTLLVTDVRVQRLQEISEDDARAEGVLPDGFEGYRGHEGTIGYPTAIWAFRHICHSIHGPGAWDANPWVAAISFTVHRCNIDTMEEGTW